MFGISKKTNEMKKEEQYLSDNTIRLRRIVKIEEVSLQNGMTSFDLYEKNYLEIDFEGSCNEYLKHEGLINDEAIVRFICRFNYYLPLKFFYQLNLKIFLLVFKTINVRSFFNNKYCFSTDKINDYECLLFKNIINNVDDKEDFIIKKDDIFIDMWGLIFEHHKFDEIQLLSLEVFALKHFDIVYKNQTLTPLLKERWKTKIKEHKLKNKETK